MTLSEQVNPPPVNWGEECNLSDFDSWCYNHKSNDCWRVVPESYFSPNSPKLLSDVSVYFDSQMPEPQHAWGPWSWKPDYDVVMRLCGKCGANVQLTGPVLSQQQSAADAAKFLEHVWANIEPKTCNPMTDEEKYIAKLQEMFPGATVVLDENAPKNKVYFTNALDAEVHAMNELKEGEWNATAQLKDIDPTGEWQPPPEEEKTPGTIPPELTEGAFDVIFTWMNTPYWSFKQDNQPEKYWEMLFVLHMPLPTGQALKEGEMIQAGLLVQQYYSILVRRVPIHLGDDRWWMECAVRQDTGEPILTVNHKGSYKQYLAEIQGEPF